MAGGDWPVPPPEGWRPPTLGEQFPVVVWGLVAVTVIVDALLGLWLVERWSEGSTVMRWLILCGAGPLNLLAVLGLVAWLVRRSRAGRRE